MTPKSLSEIDWSVQGTVDLAALRIAARIRGDGYATSVDAHGGHPAPR